MAAHAPRCVLVLALLLLLAAQPARAAIQIDDGLPAGASGTGATSADADRSGVAGRFAAYPTLWQYYEALFPTAHMKPVVLHVEGRASWHEVLYQVPDNPRATLFVAHGCAHAAHDFWPPSPACPGCLGLPEEVTQTQQALARGYAVLAMSANNTKGDQCMDWTSNHRDAVDIIKSFRKRHGLEGLPLYGLGVSVGGGFVLKLPEYLKMDGILSEVLGPRTDTYNPQKFKYGMPPTMFVSMDMDPGMANRISRDAAKLRGMGVPVATVRVAQRHVGPTFFSNRSPKISPDVSAKVVAALHDIGMLTPQGYVKVDPRKVSRAWPWVTQLLEKVPELRGGMDADHSVVWEELNLAYSSHEIIADFATVALAWFESGAKEADFERIFQRYAVPGAGIVGDPAGALPPGWVPPPDDDVRHGAKKGKAKKQQQHKAPTEDAYPYEAHEAVVEAALEAVSASGKEGGDDEAAAAADAAGAAAADAHVAALEAASVEETPRAEDKAVAAAAEQEEEGAVATTGAAVVMPAEARDQQAQHRKTYIQRSSSSSGNEEQPQGPSVTEASGRVAFATLAAGPVATTAATAVPATTASPAVSAPAKDIDSSAAKHRPAVSATAAVIGGACLTVAAVAMGLVLIRIRQRRAQGFAALPTREPALRPHGRLAPIPESPRIAGADHNDHAV